MPNRFRYYSSRTPSPSRIERIELSSPTSEAETSYRRVLEQAERFNERYSEYGREGLRHENSISASYPIESNRELGRTPFRAYGTYGQGFQVGHELPEPKAVKMKIANNPKKSFWRCTSCDNSYEGEEKKSKLEFTSDVRNPICVECESQFNECVWCHKYSSQWGSTVIPEDEAIYRERGDVNGCRVVCR